MKGFLERILQNFRKKYFGHHTLVRKNICPICPANQCLDWRISGPLATQQLFQWKFSALLLTKVCRRTAIPFIIKAVPRTNALTRFSQDGLGHQVVSPTFYGLALCRILIRKLGHFFSLSIKVVDTKFPIFKHVCSYLYLKTDWK